MDSKGYPADFSPELRLIAELSRQNVARQNVESVVCADPAVDWERFLQLVGRNGVAGLVYRRLASGMLECPEWVLKALRPHSEDILHFAGVLRQELDQLLRILGAEGIPVCTLEGPVLTDYLFPEPRDRQFSTLEILVPKRQVKWALGVLQREGYQFVNPLEPWEVNAELCFRHSLRLFHRKVGVLVELHWDFLEPVYGIEYKIDKVWRRMGQWQHEGRRSRILAEGDLLLFLCLRASTQHWSQLHWVVDVDRLIRKAQPLSWGEIVPWTKRLEAYRMLGIGLLLARGLLETPLPRILRKELEQDKALNTLVQRAVGDMSSLQRQPSLPFSALWKDLSLFETLSMKSMFSYRRFTTPNVTDYQVRKLPRRLWGLYRMFHVFRVMKEGVMSLAARGRRGRKTFSVHDDATARRIERKRYSSIRDLAAEYYEMLSQGMTREEVLEYLLGEYDVNEARLQKELDVFARELADEELSVPILSNFR